MTFTPGGPQPHWKSVRDILFRWMARTASRYGCAINMAVAMPLHVHLVVETPRGTAGLGQVLRFLSSKIALEVNRRWNRRGPLLRDRYFSRVMRTLSELVRGLRYVAMNPVKARRCARPEDWTASSVRDQLLKDSTAGPWTFRGWMYHRLGLLADPAGALRKVLDGTLEPVVARGGRQLRLPLVRGLPTIRP